MSKADGNTLAWPTPQGAVPTSVGVLSSGSGVDEILKNLATDQTLVRQAITPIAGQHVGQIPTALTKQTGSAPQTPTPYERPRSKGEAIANMINSAGNAVSQVITAGKQQKQTHLTDAATKLFTSQQALDEAQQMKDSTNAMLTNATGEEAKGYQATIAQADKLIKQNTDVRNGVLADSKMRKALAKGLNINYIDPSENKTEEHQAVQAALKNAKTIQEKREAAKKVQAERNQQGASNFGEAFAKSQPQTVAPNVIAQQKLAAFQKTQKANLAATRALIPLLSAQVRANSAASTEERREAHTDNLAFMRSQDAWDRMQAQINARASALKTEHGYRLGEIAARGSQELATFKAKLTEKDADPLTSVKAFQDFQSKTTVTQANLAKTVSELQIQRDAAAKQKPYNASMVSNLDAQLETAKQAQVSYGQAVGGIQTWYKKIAGVQEGGSSSESKSSSSTDRSAASTYLTDTAADPDEEDDNY